MGSVSAMPVQMPVRWALWGAGRISFHVAQDLLLARDTRVVAVGARRLDAARQLAGLHPGAAAADRLDALLRRDDVDAVYIATPDGRHLDDALAALEAGKHVLCEKPLTTRLEDAQRLVDAARGRRRFLMEALWTLFLPAVQTLRERIAAGEIGALRCVRGSFVYPDARAGHAPYRGAAHAMLYDRGIYLLALALHLRPGAVRALHARPIEWDDRALMQFVLDIDGQTTVDGLCGTGAAMDNGLDIVGERASLHIPGPFFKPHTHRLTLLPPAAGPSGPSSADQSGRRWMATAKQLKRRLHWLPEAVAAARTPHQGFAGNGYQFQFEEVARCLAQGRTESERVSLDFSLALARGLQMVADAAAR
jgi:predicted dehydrogenase